MLSSRVWYRCRSSTNRSTSYAPPRMRAAPSVRTETGTDLSLRCIPKLVYGSIHNRCACRFGDRVTRSSI